MSTIASDLTVTGSTHLQALDATSIATPSFATTDLTVPGTSHLGIVESTNVITPTLTLSGSPFSFLSNTYSPTVIGGPGFTVVYTTQVGKYIRVGDMVKVYFDIQFNGTVTGPLLTPLRITLPFNNAYPGQTGILSTLCVLPNPPTFPITLNLRQAGFNYGALFSATQNNTSPIMPQTGPGQRLIGTITYFATP